VPDDATKPTFHHPVFGECVWKWEYRDADNRRLGYVLRFEGADGRKTFRPLTYCQNEAGERAWRFQGFPKPLPLYGLNRLAARKDVPVVVAEGEKAADHAGDLLWEMVAVSWPHGAKSVGDVDLSPLAGREINMWPDADEEGLRAGEVFCRRCLEVGTRSIRVIQPPANVPKGWDAADAHAEDWTPEKVSKLLEDAKPYPPQEAGPVALVVDLAQWRANRYAGPPPERKWLVRGILPQGAPCMVAAIGGIGKSMTMLRLALDVTTGEPRGEKDAGSERSLGGEVCSHGSAVLITAEDDADEVHRRLHALDPDGLRLRNPERLMVVPLPNVGGIMTLLRGGFDSPQITEEFENLQRQLLAIPELKLVVLDPLQAFVGADANKDPAAGQYLCALLGKLAADTGAAVVATHHFRKQPNVKGPADAREAVRGTTALIDGMRSVYAFWSVEENYAKKICRELGMKFEPNKVVRGAVIKANWPVDMAVQTYVRDDVGLLCDRTGQFGRTEDRDALLDQLQEAIGHAAVEGKPYTKTGKSGVYDRRDELPLEIRKIGRNRLQDMVQDLLDTDRVRQCSAGKSTTVQWLDVPEGPFDRGEGNFAPGALRARR
jgi:hypothetical protein